MSPGSPNISGAQRAICSGVPAWLSAESARAGSTIVSPMPAQPQKISSRNSGSDRPVGSEIRSA